MSDELIVIEKKTAAAAFHDDAEVTKFYDRVKAKVVEETAGADVATKKGRDVIRSISAKVSKTKTALDRIGADEADEMRRQVATIDGRRKLIREKFDELRDATRKPLSDWEEAEKARVTTIEETIANIRELGRIAFGETARQIQDRIDQLPTHDLSFYAEFKDEAQLVLETSYNALVQAKTVQENREKEQAELEEQRRELARMQEDQRNREREQLRVDDIRRKIQHITDCGNGFIGGEPQPLAILLYELEKKAVVDDSYAEFKDEAERAHAGALAKIRGAVEAEKIRQQEVEAAAARQAEADRRVRDAEEAAAKAQREKEEAERRQREAEETAALAAARAKEEAAREQAEKEAAAIREKEEAEAEAAREAERAANREKIISELKSSIATVLVDKGGVDSPRATRLSGFIGDALVAGTIAHARAEV